MRRTIALLRIVVALLLRRTILLVWILIALLVVRWGRVRRGAAVRVVVVLVLAYRRRRSTIAMLRRLSIGIMRRWRVRALQGG